MKFRIYYLSFIITLFDVSVCTEIIEYKVCSGEEAQLSCESGLYINVVSGVGHFGSSGTPCTSSVSCTSVYVQDELSGANGNLGAFAINQCNGHQTCNFLVQSNWKPSAVSCDGYIIYLDLEYKCFPKVTVTRSTSSTTTTTTKPTSTQTNTTTKSTANEIETSIIVSTTTTKSNTDQETAGPNAETEGSNIAWWWYVIGGVAGLIIIIIIIIIIVCVSRKRDQKDDDSEDGRDSAMRNSNLEPDDIIPYVTNTTLSSGRKPDILHEAVDNDDDDDDDDDQTPDIDCYVTTRNTENDVRIPDDDTTSVDASGDVVTYAVVNKDMKRNIIPSVMIDNEKYVAS